MRNKQNIYFFVAIAVILFAAAGIGVSTYLGMRNLGNDAAVGKILIPAPSVFPKTQIIDTEQEITTSDAYSTFYAVIHNTLWGWSEEKEKDDSKLTKPVRISEGVYRIYKYSSYFLKLDSSLWKLREKQLPKLISYNVKSIFTGYQGEQFLLKNDGNLYRYFENQEIPILADIRKVVYYGEGAAIKNDGSLWGFGKSDFYDLGAQGRENVDPNRPFELMKDVEDVQLVWDDGPLVVGVLKKDHSFWVWGSTNPHDEGYNGKSLKISNDVKKYSVHPWYGGFVLKNDNSLWSWDTKKSPIKIKRIANHVVDIAYPYFFDSEGDLYVIDSDLWWTNPKQDKKKFTNLPIKIIGNVLKIKKKSFESELIATRKDGRIWSDVYGLLPKDVIKYYDSGVAEKKDGTIWNWGDKPVKIVLPIK